MYIYLHTCIYYTYIYVVYCIIAQFSNQLLRYKFLEKMGGHGHGHEPGLKIPSPDIYKVEDVPELKMVQEKLAKLGLKDPWLRNEVWRYTALSGTHTVRVIKGLTRGMVLGFAAFLVTLGVEHTFGITYKGEHHGDGDHH